MGTISQEILRKAHKAGQRQEIKKEVDASEEKVKGGNAKGKKESDKMDNEQPEAKGKPEADKRDLGDSSADAKKTSDQPEKK
jgi:hypothetical protein